MVKTFNEWCSVDIASKILECGRIKWANTGSLIETIETQELFNGHFYLTVWHLFERPNHYLSRMLTSVALTDVLHCLPHTQHNCALTAYIEQRRQHAIPTLGQHNHRREDADYIYLAILIATVTFLSFISSIGPFFTSPSQDLCPTTLSLDFPELYLRW